MFLRLNGDLLPLGDHAELAEKTLWIESGSADLLAVNVVYSAGNIADFVTELGEYHAMARDTLSE